MLRKNHLLRIWLGGSASIPALGIDVRASTGQFVNVIADGTQNRRTAGHFNPTPSDGLVANHFAPPELRQSVARVAQPKDSIHKFCRHLRADIYDELLKLPLRYTLHDFDHLQRHLRHVDGNNDNDVAAGQTEQPGIYRFKKAAQPPRSNTTEQGKPKSGNDADDGDDDGSDSISAPANTFEVYGVSGRASAVGYAPPLGPADPLDTIPFFVHRTSNGDLPGKVYSMDAKRLMPAFFMTILNVEGDLFRFEEELMKIFPTKKIFVRPGCVYVYNVNLDGKAILHHWLLGLGF